MGLPGRRPPRLAQTGISTWRVHWRGTGAVPPPARQAPSRLSSDARRKGKSSARSPRSDTVCVVFFSRPTLKAQRDLRSSTSGRRGGKVSSLSGEREFYGKHTNRKLSNSSGATIREEPARLVPYVSTLKSSEISDILTYLLNSF